MESIIDQLEQLAELRAAEALTRADYEQRRAEILKAVQAELDALAAEYEPLLETADKRIEALQAEIKEAVAEAGHSVRHGNIQAVYARGRTLWDTKGLSRYAEEHPEVEAFRREGKPSVSIRIKDEG
jgi:hypothetical protein